MVKFLTLVLFCLSTSLVKAQCDVEPSERMIVAIETPPVFKGDMLSFISKKLNYNNNTYNKDTIITIVVSCWIDTLGRTYDHTIKKGDTEDLNRAALRVTELISFEEPAKQNGGYPIKVKYFIPVRFVFKSRN